MLYLADLSYAYGPMSVLAGVNLRVEPGRVLALTGPSGCGKTTLLHLVAGLLTPTAGRVENRFARSAYVFQDPRLLPWRTALENVAFGLKALGVPPARQRQVALDLIERLGLVGAADKYPYQLSGGMRQRVALGRALAVEPGLLLLDEPFSALDLGLRRELQDLLLGLLAERNVATLFVTHDLAEAVRLGDELVVLSPGPGRVVYRQAQDWSGGVRDDASVYRKLAALLEQSPVAEAFGLRASGAAAQRAPAEAAR